MEDAKKAFPSLRSVHDDEQEARCNPRAEYFYHKCQLALKNLARIKDSLSGTRMLNPKALYRALVHMGCARDAQGDLTNEEFRSL